MNKPFITLLLLFLPILMFAQSNLVIDDVHIPVRVKNDKIYFKKRKKVSVKIPVDTCILDTVNSFSPETLGKTMDFLALKPGSKITREKSVAVRLRRDRFLNNPLIYLSHNGQDYAAYRCIIYFFPEGKYYGLGYDDGNSWDIKQYSLHHFKSQTLPGFKAQLEKSLPVGVSEIYITGMEFISIPAKEKLILSNTFKVILKD